MSGADLLRYFLVHTSVGWYFQKAGQFFLKLTSRSSLRCSHSGRIDNSLDGEMLSIFSSEHFSAWVFLVPPYPHMPGNLAWAHEAGNGGLRSGGGGILLNKFSKALRPTGMERTDNSWPFWSVTSLGSCTSGGRGRKCFNGSGLQIWMLLFWQLFNYLLMNGLMGALVTRER